MELLLHFMIPFVLLVTLGFKPRKAVPLALLGVVPDLDVFLLVHRSISHSIFILFLAWSPVMVYAFIKPGCRRFAALGLLVLLSHPLLDVMGSSTPILWPIIENSIHFRFSLNARASGLLSISPQFEFSSIATMFDRATILNYPIVTGEGLMLSFFLLAPIIYNSLRSRSG